MSRVNKLDEKKKASLLSRVIIGVILAATGIPAMILGSWYFLGYVAFFLLFAIYEILHATGKKYGWYIYVFTFAITLSYVFWFLIKSNISEYFLLKDQGLESQFAISLENWYEQPYLSIYGMLLSLLVYFMFSLFVKDFDFNDVAYFFMMTILVGIGFQSMLFLRYVPTHSFVHAHPLSPITDPFRYWGSLILFFYVIIATFGNDIGAYFVGVFFGKHKMLPRISPNKTWEGFVGGWLFGGTLALGFVMINEVNGFPILSSLRVFGPDSKWYLIVLLSYTLPLVANIGDFSMSLIKRHFGFKDYGKLLGAHGGVLDRVDSLMFSCAFASVLVVIFENGWRFFA